MTRSAVRVIPDSTAIAALLVTAHPGRWTEEPMRTIVLLSSLLIAPQLMLAGIAVADTNAVSEAFQEDRSQEVLRVDYESGKLNSGPQGVTAEGPTARDAFALVGPNVRRRYCVASQGGGYYRAQI